MFAERSILMKNLIPLHEYLQHIHKGDDNVQIKADSHKSARKNFHYHNILPTFIIIIGDMSLKSLLLFIIIVVINLSIYYIVSSKTL